jgi:L-alanine-DL-glutamate epimerase-like enolase superfamily enzyme
MMAVKIRSVDVIPLQIPFSGAQQRGKRSSVDVVIVRLQSNDGVIGIGETQAWRRQGSGEYLPSLVRVIRDFFVPQLIGRSPFDITAIMRDIDKSLFGALYAQAAVSDALHDLVAKLHGIPVYQLLGGKFRDRIPVGLAILVSGAFDRLLPVVEEAYERGYRHFRFKIGQDPNEDVANLKAMRQRFGNDVALRADANGALRFDQALPLLVRLQDYNLEFVEQPVSLNDIDGMAALAKIITIPISADESVSSQASVVEIIRRRAASLIQTKIGKNGGLFYCQRLWTVAHAAGIAPLAGNHPSTSVAATAMAHLYAAWPWDLPVGEFSNGPTDVLADDIVMQPMCLQKGTVSLSDRPGLGLDLDEEKLARYRADV